MKKLRSSDAMKPEPKPTSTPAPKRKVGRPPATTPKKVTTVKSTNNNNNTRSAANKNNNPPRVGVKRERAATSSPVKAVTAKRSNIKKEEEVDVQNGRPAVVLPEKSAEPPQTPATPTKDRSTGGPRKYKCEICKKVFSGSNDLRKHLRIHSDERPYQCNHCSKRFRQMGCLKNHVASQHGTDIMFICDYCQKTFPVKERLRLHLRIHSGEKPYRCPICPMRFARGGQAKQHMLKHNGVKNYKCDYCPSAFSCSANVKLHMKSHLEVNHLQSPLIRSIPRRSRQFQERDFTCHLCGRGFYRPDALKKHLTCYHANVKAFHCTICNKDFKGHLPQHMRTHKQVRPHGCATCQARFSQRSQLIVHQRIHSGERPYRCQVCWQAFAHSSVLKLHVRKHTGEKPFKCPLCVDTETAFSQLPHLKKHMSSIHRQDKAYMCETCKIFFKTKQQFLKHVLDSHPESLEDLTVEEQIDLQLKKAHSGVEPPMPISRMRLLVAILLRKISTEERLKSLGYEKRLIDNVLIDSLKCAGRASCENALLTEAERLRINVQELLEWTVPDEYMEKFKREQRSTEELLEELTS